MFTAVTSGAADSRMVFLLTRVTSGAAEPRMVFLLTASLYTCTPACPTKVV